MGYSVAIAMLLKSREPGRYAEYQQFESIRKLWAGFMNVYMASVAGLDSLHTMGVTSLSSISMTAQLIPYGLSDLHRLFESHGTNSQTRSSSVIGVDARLLLLLEQEWEAAADAKSQSALAGIGAYSVIAFAVRFEVRRCFS
jgi:hypothetical protein